MKPAVLAGYVTPEVLRTVFWQLACPGALVILEGLTDVHMQKVHTWEELAASGIDPTEYEEGRLFDKHFELYWQRTRGYPAHVPPFRTRVICDEVQPLMSIDPMPWSASSGGPATFWPLAEVASDAFVLWGEAVYDADGHATGAWYEREIPRFWHYPVDSDARTRRLCLLTKSYRFLVTESTPPQAWHMDDEAAQGLLHRFVAIVLAQE